MFAAFVSDRRVRKRVSQMSNVEVQKVKDPNGKPLPIFEEIAKQFAAIEKRAFELFESRGRMFGHELEDWLKAEHEMNGWSAAEMKEKDGALELEVTLPGFEAKDVEVTATPEEIIVHATAEEEKKKEEKGKVIWSEFGSNEVYRRFVVPKSIVVDKVAARMDKGILKITAPEAAPAKSIAVAAG